MTVRRVQDPAVRAGCELGRSGAQTKAAAQAARGRRQPEQRRRKTLAVLASISPRARAEGSRRRADEHLRVTAQQAATRLGFADSVAATLTERRHEQWDAAGCRWCARRPNRRTSAPAGPLQHPTRSHRAQRPPTHQPHPATNVTARYT